MGMIFFRKQPSLLSLQKKPAMGIFCLFVISVKTNVFLFSFTNDSLIFFQKMKEYYQFTLV